MRKSFLLATVLALLSITASADERRVENFDAGWRFAFGNAADPAKDFGCGTEYFNYLTKAASIHNAGPYSLKFDDTDWKPVDLPHDFVVDLPFAPEASHSHGYKTVGYKYPETSVGWYRKVFTLPAEDEGKHVEICFDGAFRDSRVWVNGFYCGGEPSGYLSHSYDITDYLNFGGENLVCVRTDATLEEGWFYEGGGIYRHVWLTTTAPLHFQTDGIALSHFCTQEPPASALPDCLTLSAQVEIKNSGRNSTASGLRLRVLDREGNEVALNRLPMGEPIAPQATRQLSISVPVHNVQRWSPDAPYIYKVELALESINGYVIDRTTVNYGFRDFEFDKDRGFILNGQPLKLHGVNMHQDHAGVGAGIPDGLQAYRIKRLKEIGCNAYRASHNPMSPALLDVCDSLGMLVIDENRLSGCSQYEISQLERMIRRDRNHPSIILWSVGNEEWGIEWEPKGERIAATMSDYCHQFDPTRPMTFASSSGPTVLLPVDVAGYNYIMQNPIDEYREKYPERRHVGTEETTGCGTRGVYFEGSEGFESSEGSEGQYSDSTQHSSLNTLNTLKTLNTLRGRMPALNRTPDIEKDGRINRIERGWQFYAQRPWAAGCFFWTGFDYRGEPNPLSFPATGSQFGIFDYCGFPKDEAYYLRAAWTNEPVLHILPHLNLQGHEGEEIDIWAYSNCDEVELRVNGKSLGRKPMPKDGHLSWTAVYKPGTVVANGYRNGKKIITQKIETTGSAVRVEARRQTFADGTTVYDLDLLDQKGRLVPDACNQLVVSIPAKVQFLGWGNGDSSFQHIERPTDSSTREMIIRAFNGHAQVIVREQNLTANTSNLRVSIN